MSRRNSFRQPYHLDSGDVTRLSREEVALVLRAADDLITTGGRTLLVKVLRGSKAQDIRPEHRENPAYSGWKELSRNEVSHRVDWCIENGYISLEYFGKLPLLVYPRKGLAIECQTIASEWFQSAVANGFDVLCERVSEAPMGTLMALLDQVAEHGKELGFPLIKVWKEVATKRIRKRINTILAEWNGSGHRMRCVFDTAWIDESLPFDTGSLFGEYAKAKSILSGEWKFISREHPGMMDVDIYGSLLVNKSACLVTSDRAFHNALCNERVCSFFLDTDSAKITSAPLPGVKPRGILARLPSRNHETQVTSRPTVSNPFYSRILEAQSESAQKKLRSKRRRIHNYFGGTGYIERCRLTVAALPSEKYPLVGIRLRVLSSAGINALDATESYCWESSSDLLGAYIQAACLMIQLRLERIPTDIYYDSLALVEPNGLAGSPAFAFWTQLINTFAEIKWHPVGERFRNPRMEALRRKLNTLATRPSNEVKQFNSLQLVQAWKVK
ncbi:MAG: RQC-minor-1 family DNA-binding protein [Verrucomicrobia bacterium]|nr:RQC-minor-1 family DNA-binding protein [Verrucomicrobiota bacterium]